MKLLNKCITISISGYSVLIARNKILTFGANPKVEVEFLVAKDDYMIKVDFQTFKKEMAKYKEVCMNSWNKKLAEDYQELEKVINEYEEE